MKLAFTGLLLESKYGKKNRNPTYDHFSTEYSSIWFYKQIYFSIYINISSWKKIQLLGRPSSDSYNKLNLNPYPCIWLICWKLFDSFPHFLNPHRCPLPSSSTAYQTSKSGCTSSQRKKTLSHPLKKPYHEPSKTYSYLPHSRTDLEWKRNW